MLAIAFLGIHGRLLYKMPFYELSYAWEVESNKKGMFIDTVKKSQGLRGYLVTALGELASGRVQESSQVEVERPCLPGLADTLPVVSITDKVAIIQVECLGDELLDLDINGEAVMPYLRTLLQYSFAVRLDGIKKVVSSNSDYELFNAREGSFEFINYHHQSDFSDNIFQAFKERQWDTSVYHGMRGRYTNLRQIYAASGIQHEYFLEEYRQLHFPELSLWGGMIADEELFKLPAQNVPENNFVQFIITMTMHVPEYISDTEVRFSNSKNPQFYTACRRTDEAIRKYIEALPEDATVIIYGDHTPYFGEPNGFIPFIIHVKNRNIKYDGREIIGLTRCNMAHYLRKIFGFPPVCFK